MTTRRRRRPMQLEGDREYPSDDGSMDTEHVEETPERQAAPTPSASVMEIVNRARAAREQADMDGGLSSNAEGGDGELNPATRLEQVKARAPEYEREYRLKLLHRLLIRKLPLDEIALQLEVSVSTVQRDRREVYRRLQTEASKLNINAFLGETMAFYAETGSMAMRIATGAKTAIPHRLAALRTAMTSRKELGQFFAAAGVFEQLKFIPEDEAQSGDLAKLIALSERVLLDEEETVEDLGSIVDDLEDENISLIL